MGRSRIILAVSLIGILLLIGWPLTRAWMMLPTLPALVRPIERDSELWKLMQAARAASHADEHSRAAQLFTQALAIEPGPNIISRDLHAERGSEYNFLNLAEQAFADCDAAIRIGYPAPLSTAAVRVYMGRGYAAVNLGRYRIAKDDFDIVLGTIPDEVPRSSSTLAWRGAAHQGLGDRARAVADYRAALALDGSNGYARQGLKDLQEPRPAN